MKMDIMSRLQEHAKTIASLAFNTFGHLHRDAPAVRLSQNYPEPVEVSPTDEATKFSDQSKLMSAALIKAAKQFDVLVAALPPLDGGEEVQL